MDYDFLLSDRVQKIQQMAQELDLEHKAYIAFSGGKDSAALSHLVDIALPSNSIPRVYTNTGIDYNSIVSFVRNLVKSDSRFIEIHPTRPIRETLINEGFPFKSKEHSKKYRLLWAGSQSECVKKYWRLGKYDSKSFAVPDLLLHQRDTPLPFKVSEFCCTRLKKEPAHKWAVENGKSIVLTGIRASEGGQRANVVSCVAFSHGKPAAFNPLLPMSDAWVEEFIRREKVELCELYLPPFNFKRTGCKGCPFNLYLQENLDTLERFFPKERAQCEFIFHEVYEEYRALGYRLRTSRVF